MKCVAMALNSGATSGVEMQREGKEEQGEATAVL